MAEKSVTKPGRRRWKRWAVIVGVLAVFVGAGVWFVTSSGFVESFVMRRIGQVLGGSATAQSVSVTRDGHVVIVEGSLRAPGVPGTAGEIFHVRRLTADVDFSTLFSGTPVVRSVEIDEPVARISQSVDDESVNVAALHPLSGAPGGRIQIPRVLVRKGLIELGEHVSDPSRLARLGDADPYTMLKRFGVEGEVERAKNEQGDMRISFRQTQPGGDNLPQPLTVTGVVGQDQVTLELGAVSLSGWKLESMPGPVRRLMKELQLNGDVSGASLMYHYSGGLEATVGVQGVSMTLPLTPQPGETREGKVIPLPPEEAARRLRMRDVTGSVTLKDSGVTGRFTGLVEDLPYEVTLTSDSASLDTAFRVVVRCRDFEFTRQPEILRFAPGVARLRLEQFGNPTGTVDVEVAVFREKAPEGKDAPIHVGGVLRFKDTTAAFERFPYRFEHMSGEVEFDDEKIVLKRITGTAPSGATVEASGIIAPPTSEAGVDIDVRMSNLPVDETLARALHAHGRIYDELFSHEQYERLVREGLVLPGSEAAKLREELAALGASGQGASARGVEIARRLEAPVFDLGGVAMVTSKVTRTRGEHGEWFDTITIDFPWAHMLPAAVPYPLLCEDVRAVKNDFLVNVTHGRYRGLLGGNLEITANADMALLDRPGMPFIPNVDVKARNIPISPLLVSAVPDPRPGEGAGSVRAMLGALHASGAIDADAHAEMNEQGKESYRVAVRPLGASASAHAEGAPDRLRATDVRGEVVVTPEAVRAALSAELLADGTATSPVKAEISLDTRPGATPGDVTLEASSPGWDGEIPVEDLVSIFAPDAGAELASMRAVRRPSGVADVHLSLSRSAGLVGYRVDCRDGRRVSAMHEGKRYAFDQRSGVLTFVSDKDGRRLTAMDFKGNVLTDSTPDGEVEASGTLPVDGQSPAPGTPATLRIRGGRFESSLLREGLRRAGSTKLADLLDSYRVAGLYDLDLSVGPDRSLDESPIRGVLRPRSASLSVDDSTRLGGDFESGTVSFTNRQARLNNIVIRGDAWTFGADATIVRSDDDSASVHADVRLDAASLTKELRAALPAEAIGALDAMKMRVDGALRLEPSSISIVFRPDGSAGAMDLELRARVKDAALSAGVDVDGATGAIDLSLSRRGAGQPISVDVKALLPSLRCDKVWMSSGRIRAVGEAPGVIRLPLIAADCHDGRVAGTAELGSADEKGGRDYRVELRMSDVRFAPFLKDLGVKGGEGVPAEPSGAGDLARGVVDAGVSITGRTDDPDRRRGRGSATIGGGRVVVLPLVVPLIRASNLQLPTDEKLDFAGADFFLRGDTVEFEQLSVSSATVEIFGYGTMRWPGSELDLRFRPKARSRIPLLTGVLEGIRNELLSATVKGTLSDPQISVTTMTGTRRLLGKMVGRDETDQQRRLDAIEQRARRTPRLSRPETGREAPEAPPSPGRPPE